MRDEVAAGMARCRIASPATAPRPRAEERAGRGGKHERGFEGREPGLAVVQGADAGGAARGEGAPAGAVGKVNAEAAQGEGSAAAGP